MSDEFKPWPETEGEGETEAVPVDTCARPRRIQLQRNGEVIAELYFDRGGRLVQARVRNGAEAVNYALVVA